jgi:recombinational DNA repair protein (RecF pathway)
MTNRHEKYCEVCGKRMGTDEPAYALQILDEEGYMVSVDACTDCKGKDGDDIFDFEEIVCSDCGEEAPIIRGVYDEVGWTQHEYGWRCPKDAIAPEDPSQEVTVEEADRLTSAIDALVKELPPEDQFKVAIIRACEEYLNLLGVEYAVEDYANSIAEATLDTLNEWLGKK